MAWLLLVPVFVVAYVLVCGVVINFFMGASSRELD